MNKISIETLAKITNAKTSDEINGFFNGVSTDTRTIQHGNCFFAVPGENFDGHDYIQAAFDKGAACAVVSARSAKDFPGKAVLEVADTIKALGLLAAEYRRLCCFKVISITGSAGKTTTRQIISHVLSGHYPVTQSPKNFNNFIGLPLTLLAAKEDDRAVVAELGTNHPGEISYLSRIAQPDIAVVTNAYAAHLEGLGSVEAVIKEKLSISQGLLQHGVFIINYDCPGLVKECEKLKCSFITFGKTPLADIYAENIICAGRQSTFVLEARQIMVPLPGPGNAENAIAAWAVCKQLGITIDEFAQSLGSLPEISMRSQIQETGSITLINDCYNANPASMKNALAISSSLNTDGKRRFVFICGDMAELGEQSERLHAELGADAAKAGVNLLLTVGCYGRITADAARSEKGDMQINCFEDTNFLCNNMENFIKDSDIILVKGSRVNKLETAVEQIRQRFDKNKK